MLLSSFLSNVAAWIDAALRTSAYPNAVGVGLAMALLPGTVASQEVFRAEVREVRVFVRTERRGSPVAGLMSSDFEVKEDGKPVGPVRVTWLAGGLNVGDSTDPPPADHSNPEELSPGFAIVADDYVAVDAATEYMARCLREFIDGLDGISFLSLTAPASRIAVAGRLPGALAGITAGLDRLKPSEEYRRIFFPGADRLSITPAELRALSEAMREGRLAAIRAACRSLESVRGDRMLLLVAERPMDYDRAFKDLVLAQIQRCNARLFSLQYRPTTTQPVLSPLTTQEAPINGSLGAGRPRPGRGTFFGSQGPPSNDLGHEIAMETGGFSTRGTLPSSLALASRAAESTYLLSYASALGSDGQFHKIEVKVRQKGVTVTHRKGYFAN